MGTRFNSLCCWFFFLPCFQDPIHSGGAMEVFSKIRRAYPLPFPVFLSAVLVIVTVVLLVSFVLLAFTTKQRVTILVPGSEVYDDSNSDSNSNSNSNSSNGRSSEVPDLLCERSGITPNRSSGEITIFDLCRRRPQSLPALRLRFRDKVFERGKVEDYPGEGPAKEVVADIELVKELGVDEGCRELAAKAVGVDVEEGEVVEEVELLGEDSKFTFLTLFFYV
ncbi:hypothetical protein LINGRAPRIM_LOCUS2207 [Linum grandiflorum]